MAYLDYKVTCWKRVKITQDSNIDKIIEDLKKNDPYDALERNDAVIEDSFLYETETYIHPVDNDDQSTVEIYNEVGQLIYQNGK